MAKKSSSVVKSGSTNSEKTSPRSAAILGREIRSDSDYLAACWAVADDLANARFAPSVGNGIAMNMRNMIKMHDIKFKHGQSEGDGKQPNLAINGR